MLQPSRSLSRLLPTETNGSFQGATHLLSCEPMSCWHKGLRKGTAILTTTDLFYACTKEGWTDILIFISTKPCIWKGKIKHKERAEEAWKINTGPPSHPSFCIRKGYSIRTVNGAPSCERCWDMQFSFMLWLSQMPLNDSHGKLSCHPFPGVISTYFAYVWHLGTWLAVLGCWLNFQPKLFYSCICSHCTVCYVI